MRHGIGDQGLGVSKEFWWGREEGGREGGIMDVR
jgi:hypothetical protein